MEIIGAHPGRKIIAYFVGAIIIGSALLLLPVSTTGPQLSVVDALFTATSAVCVTGLIVADTGKDFSMFGQIVILVLIQLGGWGIMTFATVLLLFLGFRLSLLDRLGLFQSIGKTTRVTVRGLLLSVVLASLTVELIGAAALFVKFKSHFPPATAAYHAVFHAVSAFCNAGFSTFSTSLEGYRNDVGLLLIFAALIIWGGLGFVVTTELLAKIAFRKSTLSLHTKLCLATSAILLVGGTLAFLVSEHVNLFDNVSFARGLTNAFFQAATARTAGFNAIRQADLTEVGVLVTIILMFIGACPGSTGGGIKTTTAAVVFLLVLHRFLGRRSVPVFRRSISNESIIHALTVLILAVIVVTMMFTAVMFAVERPLAHWLTMGWFVDNLFETVSAFSTVGLSLGMTSHLNTAGKVLIILSMFIGRVGFLTLAFSLVRPPRRGELVYAEETVMVG